MHDSGDNYFMSLSKPSYELREIPEGPDLEKLLNGCFPVPKGASFFDDFPVWRGVRGISMLRAGCFDGLSLVASACVRLAPLRTARGIVTAAIIGGVATSEAHRGRGMASELVRACLDWAKSRSAKVALLWGSEHELYAKLGFSLTGEQLRAPLSALELPRAELTVNMGWNPAIFTLLKNRTDGLAVIDVDRSWVEAHRNVNWLWTGTKDKPSAYAAWGRGIDLPNLVHEWGGDRTQLLGILAKLQVAQPHLELLGSEAGFQRMGLQTESATREHLCLGKSLDESVQISDFQPFWIWGLDAA